MRNTRAVEEVANAVLYEGYLLYPYRASALKNQQRWNFGVIYPRSYSTAQGEIEPWVMQTQCLVAGNAKTSIEGKIRFLRLIERMDTGASGMAWQEATPQEIALPEWRLGELGETAYRQSFYLPEERTMEGEVTRHQQSVEATIELQAKQLVEGTWQLSVCIENVTPWQAANSRHRESVLSQSLVSTHTIVYVSGGEFVSLLDPPTTLRDAAARCKNIGTWPVLAGEAPRRDTILSAPIILYDYPQIASESPGELFDGTEIDEILTLRILTMTDAEKQEARRTDERARRILDRTEALPPENFIKLHGVLRAVASGGADV